MPPLGVAVNVTLAPEQIAPTGLAEILTPAINALDEFMVTQLGLAVVPALKLNTPQSVLNIVSPVAGLAIVFLCVVDIRGISMPLLIELISNKAELSGAAPAVLTATPPCAFVFSAEHIKNILSAME